MVGKRLGRGTIHLYAMVGEVIYGRGTCRCLCYGWNNAEVRIMPLGECPFGENTWCPLKNDMIRYKVYSEQQSYLWPLHYNLLKHYTPIPTQFVQFQFTRLFIIHSNAQSTNHENDTRLICLNNGLNNHILFSAQFTF